MKILFATVLLIVSTAAICAQKSVSDLLPSHAAALQKYLAANKDAHFMQEIVIDDDDLKAMRKYIRRGLKPYYAVGDLNRDGIRDFAVLLSGGRTAIFRNEEEAEARRNDVDLRLVIFNGTRKGGFTVAHIEEIEAPLESFIDIQGRQLYFAVFESDADTRIFAKAGKGYIVEFEKSR